MVATSKMKRAQERVTAARPFANVLADVISGLYSAELAERFPLLRQPATFGAPRCRAHRESRARRRLQLQHPQGSAQVLARLSSEKVEAELHVVGRKGLGYFRFVGRKVASSRTDIGDRPSVDNVSSSSELVE